MPDEPTDQQLDARLQQMARASLDHDAAAVDAETELAALQTRLAEGNRFAAPTASRSNAGRWLAAVAAALLVIGGVVAIAWARTADDGAAVTPLRPESTITPQTVETTAAAATSTLPVEPVPASGAPESSTSLPTAWAVAEPITVRAGGQVMITPSGVVERACDFLIRTVRQDGSAAGQLGSISPGSWSAGIPKPVAAPNCAGTQMVTDEPLTVAIPRNMPAGTYDLCLTANLDPAGCARVTIEGSLDEATAEPSIVTVGELVTITPAGVVERACQDIVTLIPLGNPTSTTGQLIGGQWIPAGPATQITYPPCEGEVSDAAVQFVVAVDTPPGVYAMCLVEQASYAVQESSDPGCAIVTVVAAPLPACWTEPVAPPTLSDGSVPGDPVIDQIGRALWGDPGSPAAVWQTLGRQPNSWWLDESPDGVQQVGSGSARAAVAVGGDFAGAPKIILVRGTDSCDREYEVGPLQIEEAVALAQDWVDALAQAG